VGRLEFVHCRWSSLHPSLHQRIEARIDVEVTGGEIGAGGRELPDASRPSPPSPSQIEHEPASEPARQLGKLGVGCLGHSREKIQRSVRVFLEELVERFVVELAELRGNLREAVLAVQVTPADRSSAFVGERLFGVVASQDLVVVVSAALRPFTFPWFNSGSAVSPSASAGSMICCQSAVMISSGVDDAESWSLILPDSAVSAASSPTVGSVGPTPRRVAS
jgi:hypothetical protein